MLTKKGVLPLLSFKQGRGNKPSISHFDLHSKHCRFSTKAGYFALDYTDITPGSVILTSATNIAVNAYQQWVLPKANNRIWMWSHVAIMGNDGYVWDVMPSIHVRRLPFETFISEAHYVAARCFRHAAIEPDFIQRKIAEQSHASYSHFTPGFLTSILRSVAHRQADEFKPNLGELVCSSYVDRILGNALGRDPLDDLTVGYPLPAHFALSSNFTDILLRNKFFRLES